MALRDVINGFVQYLPLFISKGDIPILLTPTGNLSGTANTAWPLVLASGASTTAQLIISNDCELEIVDWVASTTCPDFPNILGFNVNIWWGNRQVQLTQTAAPGELIFGTAQRPGYWGNRPWRVASLFKPGGDNGKISANANIQFEITNTNRSGTNTIWFAMRGWRTARPQEG